MKICIDYRERKKIPSFEEYIKSDKTKIIDESKNFPVPIVYRHDGHAIVCFIDKNFVLRGDKPVVVSG